MRILLPVSCLLWLSASATAKPVIATSFADPSDIAAYQQCIDRRQASQNCLAQGDNGVGLWGDATSGDNAICALPRGEWLAKWGSDQVARGKQILVTYQGKSVTCELRDTMPTVPKNGAGIDLNPGAARALGLVAPFKVDDVDWRWID